MEKEVYDSLKGKFEKLNCQCTNPYMGIFPCRRCANCLAARTRLWTQRILNEVADSTLVVPFCLTYTNDMLSKGIHESFVVYNNKLRKRNLEVDACYSFRHKDLHIGKMETAKTYNITKLSRRDVQNFLKRFRKCYNKITGDNLNFKYLVKGEYGDLNLRPHYHGVFFIYDNVDEHIVKECILNAWYNGIYKEEGQEVDINNTYNTFSGLANLNTNLSKCFKENNGTIKKVIGINPIVEFENFSRDKAHYVAKYTTKESIETMFKSLNKVEEIEVPSHHTNEFMLSSCHFGVNAAIKEQCSLLRTRIINLTDRCIDLNDKDFLKEFEKATTFFWSQSSTFIPYFLKSQIFDGYYKYYAPQDDTKESKDEWEQVKYYGYNKEWIGNPDMQYYRDCFIELLDRARDIKFNNYLLSINYNTSILDNALSSHIAHVNKCEQNRVNGALKKRLAKIYKRADYTVNKADLDYRVNEIIKLIK